VAVRSRLAVVALLACAALWPAAAGSAAPHPCYQPVLPDPTGAGSTADPFCSPRGLAADNAGLIYVAGGTDDSVSVIDVDGSVRTLAGSGDAGFADGPAEVARFFDPEAVALDAAGTVYVADTYNNRIRRIAPDGTVTTLAGSGTHGFADGSPDTARFAYPRGLTLVGDTLYVADTDNNRIRAVDVQTGLVSTIAGGDPGFADGPGTTARFRGPPGIDADLDGNLYVADRGNERLRKIAPDGTVTTLAGTGEQGDADGPPGTPTMNLSGSAGVAVDANGVVYVAEPDRIRVVEQDGSVRTLATGFGDLRGITIDDRGDLEVSDQGYGCIDTVTPTGGFMPLAGVCRKRLPLP
jgi:sugar lactone lactonase YvrE